MKIRYLPGQLVGIAIVCIALFVTLSKGGQSESEREIRKVVMGTDMSEVSIHSVIPIKNKLVSTHEGKFFYVLVSPHCEHCRNFLNLLKEDSTTLLGKGATPIKIVFNRTCNDVQVDQFMRENQFYFVPYKADAPSVLDNFNAFPTFIYVQAGKIKQVHTGGVSTTAELRMLLRSMKNTQWKQKQLSVNQSACSS